MGRKRKRAKESKAAEQQDGDAAGKAQGQQPYNSSPPDPPSRLIAVHPAHHLTAVAFGKQLAITARRDGKHELVSENMEHADVIRAVAFDPTGTWLLSADDSKAVKLWRTSDWTCAHTFTTAKKPSAAAFSVDGAFACVADKFGDVVVASTATGTSAPLLGHYCSTVTSLAVSPDGRFLASVDRDNKVRVSPLPPDPLQGAHDIQCYCLGHTSFLTAAAFISGEGGASLLATASGDGSVRLWNHLTGDQLACEQLTQPSAAGAPADMQTDAGQASPEATAPSAAVATAATPANGASETQSAGDAAGQRVETAAAAADSAAAGAPAGTAQVMPAEAGSGGQPEVDEDECPAVISLAVSHSSEYLAAAIEGEDALQVLRVRAWTGRNCGRLKGKLERHQSLTIKQVSLPTNLAFATSADGRDQLWTAGGPLQGDGCRAVHVGCATLAASQFFEDDAAEPSEGLAAALQQCHLPEGTAEVTQLSQHLRIRPYTQEEMAAKKMQRADMQIRAATAAASDPGKDI